MGTVLERKGELGGEGWGGGAGGGGCGRWGQKRVNTGAGGQSLDRERVVGEGTEMKEKGKGVGREGCGEALKAREGEAWQGEMGGPAMGSAGEILGKGAGRKGPREGRKEPHRGGEGPAPGLPSTLPPPRWGSAIWQKRSLEEAELRGCRQAGRWRDRSLAENRDWRLETGREREGRPAYWGLGVSRGRWGRNG